MSLTAEEKHEIVHKYGTSEIDTGATEVQVALLTVRIKSLTEHCKINKQDFHSRHGLLNLVNKRRSLLNYLKNKSVARYKSLISSLGLRS